METNEELCLRITRTALDGAKRGLESSLGGFSSSDLLPLLSSKNPLLESTVRTLLKEYYSEKKREEDYDPHEFDGWCR